MTDMSAGGDAGPSKDMVAYFDSIGYKAPAPTNSTGPINSTRLF